MESHEKDLRAVVMSDQQREAVQENYRSAGLSGREVALLDFAVKLTKEPSGIRQRDLDTLRSHGFIDEELVDAVQCISYFNFINRVLDGLGVDPEPSMRYGKKREMPRSKSNPESEARNAKGSRAPSRR
jgi:uncharacterized peroxidase-related enzyme